MKKLSLLLVAFALLTGLSQCRKPKLPVLNGETQHVVLNASWDNGGSKIEQEGTGLKWKIDDELYVNCGDELIGTLKCTDVTGGIFKGDIIKKPGEQVTFTFKSKKYKKDFMNQTGLLNDAVRLSGESEYKADGKYDVSMTMPHAVMKLDLSALGTEEGTTVTIKADDTEVASVEGVTKTSTKVYVAVPESGAEKAYCFYCNVVTAGVKWSLAKNTFYTSGVAGAPTGEAIKIVPAKFSVSKSKTVNFSRGNLYWDGSDSKWKFEANQWSFANTWSVNHVSYFYWSKYADEAKKKLFDNDQDMSTGDVFFTNLSETTANPDFQVDGESVGTWRSLSRDEWCYLLGFDPESATKTETYGRPGAKAKCTWKSLDGGRYKGFVILPDDTENPSVVMNSIESTSDIATYGAVFLPAAGYHCDTGVEYVGSLGVCWSSTACGDKQTCAYRVYFGPSNVTVLSDGRMLGRSVRLVR